MIFLSLLILSFIVEDIKQNFELKEIENFAYSVPLAVGVSLLISPADIYIQKNIKSEDLRKIGEILSLPGDGLFLVPLSISGYFIFRNSPKLRKTFIRTLISLGITSAIVQIIKFSGRLRPYASPNNQWRFSPLSLSTRARSFPSGHSQASAAVYLELAESCSNSMCRAFFFSIPVIVSFGRILSNQHWFSDTIGGLIIGASFEIF